MPKTHPPYPPEFRREMAFSKPGFPRWMPSTCPNAAEILAKTPIPPFTRRAATLPPI